MMSIPNTLDWRISYGWGDFPASRHYLWVDLDSDYAKQSLFPYTPISKSNLPLELFYWMHTLSQLCEALLGLYPISHCDMQLAVCRSNAPHCWFKYLVCEWHCSTLIKKSWNSGILPRTYYLAITTCETVPRNSKVSDLLHAQWASNRRSLILD